MRYERGSERSMHEWSHANIELDRLALLEVQYGCVMEFIALAMLSLPGWTCTYISVARFKPLRLLFVVKISPTKRDTIEINEGGDPSSCCVW